MHEKYRHNTNLSNYVWDVKKKQNRSHNKMGNKCHKYRGGDRYCLLCIEEKLSIVLYIKILKNYSTRKWGS